LVDLMAPLGRAQCRLGDSFLNIEREGAF